MTRLLFLTIVAILFSTMAFSQDSIHLIKNDTVHLKTLSRHKIYTDRRPQAIFAELGGPGILSANYDIRFKNQIGGWGFRAGFGYNFNSSLPATTIPIDVNCLLGHTSKGRFLELGMNETMIILGSPNQNDYLVTYTVGGKDLLPNNNYFMTSFVIGYRSQPNEGGFNFRGGLMPIFFEGATDVGIYLSLGLNF